MPDASADAARALIQRAVRERVFPAASAEVGDSSSVLWREAFGTLTFDADAPETTEDVIFDLASLTKPIATTSLVMDLIANESIALHDRVSSFFPEWSGGDRETVTVQDLLEHASGLSARLVDRPPSRRREFEHEICAMPLEYGPRSAVVYSDLGFILLGFLVADRRRDSLASGFGALYQRVMTAVGADADRGVLAFTVPHSLRSRTAPTRPLDDDVRRGEILTGEVHDNYAAALGGEAGHAGLFGTAGSVGAFAQCVLRGARGDNAMPIPFTPFLVAQATAKSSVPRSSRALGWDTMLPTSSCGTELSPAAFGHVGFTGTSLWIDPVLDRYFVLLTNRVYGGGTSEDMQIVRRAFHDLVARLGR